ncbi:MAG: hypothetical protein LBU73_09500 [Helicobacteraceae bacterium]|jgi:hypothetical protein|nr:hypothetical protein [Helicobacteraceae bacterium]
MKKLSVFLVIAAFFATFFLSCSEESLTRAGLADPKPDKQVDPSVIEKYVQLDVGESRNIELPIAVEPLYAISTATTTVINAEINLTNSQNIRYEIAHIAHAARPALRIVGVKGGIEAIAVQIADFNNPTVQTLRLVAIVNGAADNDIVGGSPCTEASCGGGNGPGPEPPPGPTDPGEKPTYDPDACTTAGFYYLEDTYQDLEGKFSGDRVAYIRSLMSGNVDSLLRLYYPNLAPPSNITHTDFGKYLVRLKLDNGRAILVEFELQLSQHLFGQNKKYFYVETNGYCLRGEIPSSVMSPPNKSLIWVYR